jgi:ferredoxin-NADP reductase
MLTPTVRELTFERVDGAPLTFEAGQWVNLHLRVPATAAAEGELKRAYSIASAPDGTGRFQLAVTRVDGGPGSTALHGLEIGATVSAVGPQGFFTRTKDQGQPALFVGTGTGLTPLWSMIRASLASEETAPLALLLGVRFEEEILYRSELTEAMKAHPRFRFDVTLSRPHDQWQGRTGYVQTHARELYEGLRDRAGGAAPHVYVCGLHKMVSAMRDLVRKEMGLPRELVHSERYD